MVKNRLKEILDEQSKTQMELGIKCGFSSSTISNIVNNKTIPDLDSALRIADYLSVPLNAVFYLEQEEEKVTRDEVISFYNEEQQNLSIYNVNMTIGVPMKWKKSGIMKVIEVLNKWIHIFKVSIENDLNYKIVKDKNEY